MASRSFHEVFHTATKHHPYPYQERLATCESIPKLLHVPTAGAKPPQQFSPGLAPALCWA